MQINLSERTIKTVYHALKSKVNKLEWGKHMYPHSKEEMKNVQKKIDEVEDALAVFEELMELIS